jgi:predicted glycogen debranching enzyme
MEISLDKGTLQDLDKASSFEWLEKNNKGIYSSSTAIGMNTRREHGLFVVPDQTLEKKVVLLSKFEESIFIENRLHEISTNTYSSGIFPSGYTYLKSFKMKPFPTSIFEIEGRIIEKTVFLLSEYSILVVRYELKNQGKPLNLIIKPFLADRFSTDLSKELQGLNTDSYIGNYFVRWALKPAMPEIYVYYSSGEFVSTTLWYKNFYYPKDNGKYNDTNFEHLFNPGFFQTTLAPYQAVDLYISTNELETDNLNYEALFKAEKERRITPREGFFTTDNNIIEISSSLKKSLITVAASPVVSVSFLENIYTTRDMIFSLPGMFLAHEDYAGFKDQYLTLVNQLSEGLLPVHSPIIRKKNHYCAADLSLWLINLGYIYYKLTKDIEFFNNGVFQAYQSIIEYYQKGTLNNIYVDKDNLVFSGNKSSSTSWIPLTAEDNEVMRYGKLLEINSLWYNAIKITEHFSDELGKKRKAVKYLKLSEKVKESFIKTFVQDDGTLIDFSVHDTANTDFRINQIVPLALSFSPLDDSLQSKLLKQVDAHLLTPYGLKSAKNDLNGPTVKILTRRMSSFYNGAIWPWTVGLYVCAALKNAEDIKIKATQLKDYFNPLPKLISQGLLNHLPEAFSDSENLIQSGIEDFTPSLSCLLWAFFELEKYADLQ